MKVVVLVLTKQERTNFHKFCIDKIQNTILMVEQIFCVNKRFADEKNKISFFGEW